MLQTLNLFVLLLAFLSHAEEARLIPGGFHTPPFPRRGENSKVWIPAFRLDTRPVSVGKFLTFVRENPTWRKSRIKPLFADSTYLSSWSGDLNPPAGTFEKPVTRISWYAAKQYCSALGKRLPGTQEWERVAGVIPEGIDSATYSKRILEWYGKPSSAVSEDSGCVNAFGVQDLFGRIWEWTSDYNLQGSAGIGPGDRDSSFFCGGGAATAKASGVDYATYMRFAFRSSLKPEFSTGSLGFRCAEDVGNAK